MATQWAGSTRKDRLPPNWATLRATTLNRAGHRCQATMRNGNRCRDKATQVDHIQPGDNHHPDNLQALCAWHHAKKTAAEGNQARPRWHPRTTKHPGIL